jgi:hypothetical protein
MFVLPAFITSALGYEPDLTLSIELCNLPAISSAGNSGTYTGDIVRFLQSSDLTSGRDRTLDGG